jgi:hypothetical protein
MIGRVEVDGARYYRVGELLLPSITTIIGTVLRKPWLERWRGELGNQEADRILEEAARHGSEQHALAETGGHELIEAWIERQGLWVLEREKTVFSLRKGFAGTTDLTALGEDALCIVDYKTSRMGRESRVRDEWRLQTAAYALALQDMGEAGREVRRFILHLPSNQPGILIAHELDRLEEDQQAFLACLRIFQWKLRREGLPSLRQA